MAVTQPAEKYTTILGLLADAVAAEAKAVLQGTQGAEVSPHFGITKATPEEVRKGFLRQALEKDYQELYTSKELDVGTCISLAFQSDILAGMEKAYNMRHRRRLDYLVSGTARAHGVSAPNGLLRHALPGLPLTSKTNPANG